MAAEATHDFFRLTRIGQIRRIGRLAAAALDAYGIKVRTMRIHSFETNLLYAVRSQTGERYMLRMAYPGWRTLEDLQAEAAWLQALDKDTDIRAQQVIPSLQGEFVLPLNGSAVPTTWYATLMTWVDGRLLGHHLTTQNLQRMGQLFAKLHQHGEQWQPPANFTNKRFEAFLSRGEPDAIFDGGLVDGFDDKDKQAFWQARQWVEAEYSRLCPSDLRVIHCDLWHDNIKVDGGRLRPFDFEDTIWGYRLHDMAMGLLDLLETVGHARYQELRVAFRAGYEQLLDWPEGNLEVLQIGRLLWVANWVARFDSESLDAVGQKYGEVFRHFADSGELRLPPQS